MTTEVQPRTSGALDVSGIVDEWFGRFAEAMTTPGAPTLGDLLAPDAWWRDFLGLDWQLASYGTPDVIVDFVRSAPQMPLTSATVVANPGPSLVDFGALKFIEVFFSWTTANGSGLGHVRLVEQSDGAYRAWTVLLFLQELAAYPLAVRHRRERPARGGGLAPWHEQRAAKSAYDRADPEVLVVGAGGAGMAVASFFGAMGIDALVIDKNERAGDNWRKRYEALVLHSPMWADAMPMMPYPTSWPVYPSKAKYADWLESFSRAMDLNIWFKSEIIDATFDEDSQAWRATVRTPQGERVIHPKELVIATGFTGQPITPDVPGLDAFRGTAVHSNDYWSATEWAGKKAIVIGAGTSAHDIAEDLYHAGAEVRMIQRSGVYICSREHGNGLIYEAVFNEDSLPTEYNDLQALSFAWPLAMQMAPAQTQMLAELDKDLLDGLREAGFLLTTGHPDIAPEGGLNALALQPGGASGYYIDAGASQLIIDRKVALHTGAGLVGYTENGIILSDGTEYEADLVVLATGYVSLRESSRDYLGDEVVDQTAQLGGLDHRNERGLQWQPSGYPHLWYTGGGLIDTRPYSRVVALQVAANLLGINTRGGGQR